MAASGAGHTETVEVLLEHGANLDLPDHVRILTLSNTSDWYPYVFTPKTV